MNSAWLIVIAVLGLAGCAPERKMTAPAEAPPAQSNAAPAQKSTAREAVEGLTGKTAVDAGQRTKAKIERINIQRRENFEEVAP